MRKRIAVILGLSLALLTGTLIVWQGFRSSGSPEAPFEQPAAKISKKRNRKPPPSLYPGHRILRDINYGTDNLERQRLDLYLPNDSTIAPSPVVVYIHAGGWESGEKESADILLPQLLSGTPYAGVSINYRLTGSAVWPAQIDDCRAAIRWIKANAAQHHLDPTKIAVTGISAGAHLAAMLGVSGHVDDWEGDAMRPAGGDASVCAVIGFSGAYNFLSWDPKLSVHDPEDPKGIIPRLLGGTVSRLPDRAKSASPVFLASARAAPFLLIHGDADDIVSINQTVEMHSALKTSGAESCFIKGLGGVHYFQAKELFAKMRQFLAHHLMGEGEKLPSQLEIDVR